MNGKNRLLLKEQKDEKSDCNRYETSAQISSDGCSGSSDKNRSTTTHTRQSKWRKQALVYPQLESLLRIKFVPSSENIFTMFNLLNPNEIKVVIMGQDPYPTNCKITNIPYACGPAFKIPDNVKSCPQSLKNLFTELKTDIIGSCREKRMNITLDSVKKHINYWISQGVFLTNASLTRGTENSYLDDHKMFWMNFTISFIKSIKDCPIVLLGSDAWKFEKFANTKVLKFYHPASRDNKFFGCKMFTKINENISGDKIKWIF